MPIFAPPDGRVARQQIAYARAVADFLRVVRTDPYATPAQKQAALSAIEGVSISPQQTERILVLRDETWAKTEAEMLNVLDLAMRGEIRESSVVQVRFRIPAMVSVDLTEEQAAIAGSLAQQFIAPNTFLDSRHDRRRARQSAPVRRTGLALLQRRTNHRARRANRLCAGY